jgi:hypothetical protein
MIWKRAERSMVFALVATIGLTGCVATPDSLPEPTASVEPQFTFFPAGTASQNLPIFENVFVVTGAGKQGHDLSESVALLVETGFDLGSITHTPVNSKIGEPSDSVSLAVEFSSECLIAQFSSTWLTVAVADRTVSGCLIGDVEKASLE